MGATKPFILFAFLFGCAQQSNELARDPFLRPYVEQLKKSTPADTLRAITAMAESELILLHHGYGTGIRNRWIHGGRDPELVSFFRARGINHPDDMSMTIIEALWHELNRSLSAADRASIRETRASAARRRKNYETLESECEAQLVRMKSEFERCYMQHGLPSKNPVLRDPFSKLIVGNSGAVREIIFFEGASQELKSCLATHINEFKFSAFSDDEFVTLYILEFPRCRVAERDKLHN